MARGKLKGKGMKYYTPKIEEFHVGFEYEYKLRIRDGIYSYIQKNFRYVDRWRKDVFRVAEEKTIEDLLRGDTESPPRTLDEIEQYLKDGAIRAKRKSNGKGI